MARSRAPVAVITDTAWRNWQHLERDALLRRIHGVDADGPRV